MTCGVYFFLRETRGGKNGVFVEILFVGENRQVVCFLPPRVQAGKMLGLACLCFCLLLLHRFKNLTWTA